ncbi:CDGSH iron-sulfur domain-containing protein [Magnetofaba australis]|uniref:Putative zinc finger CDGSH-type domain-containing protein n=1 Tax=Magnetofaba australis IT-1 TaxID=1434232 RepID=A0A1Y2K3J1_9PROT|nr:CDGSH iron-sulfur domain-containing protein [Magnetofaba australis]OSM02573.1 putative zinc finger CDGSH-type domain-containing protein [Magnetofaba australis IT-1]
MGDMHPVVAFLEAGEHRICHCGESETFPVCDGEQDASACRKAAVITVDKDKYVPICQCGRSSSMPVCDGRHGYAE